MKIMHDIDGLVADFVYEFTSLANGLFPEKVILPHGCLAAQEWGFKSILSNSEVDKVWKVIYSSDSFWKTITPMFTRADSTALWRIADKHELFWVTSRSGKDAIEQTRFWLRDQALPNWDNAVLAGENKSDYIQSHHFDVIIDDSPTQIERMAKYAAATNQLIVIRDTPYNRHLNEFNRVYSIAEFEVFLDECDKG